MRFDDELTSAVVSRILGVSRPQRIIVFLPCKDGEGEDRIGVLVLKDQVKRGEWETIRIQAALQGLGRAFDVLVMGTDYFEQARDILGSPAWPAAAYGQVVYPATKAVERVQEIESSMRDPGPSNGSITGVEQRATLDVGLLPQMAKE